MLGEYNPEREHTICAIDPALDIDWPVIDSAGVSWSDRDAAAPSLDDVRAPGRPPAHLGGDPAFRQRVAR